MEKPKREDYPTGYLDALEEYADAEVKELNRKVKELEALANFLERELNEALKDKEDLKQRIINQL